MSKGEIIRNLIKHSGLSIAEIAKKLDVDRRTVYTYMKKDNLKPETLRQISIACGVEPNFLLKKMLEKDILSSEGIDKLNDDKPIYKTNALYEKEAELLKTENRNLMRKLIELQEKHIKLQEDFLSFRKSLIEE